MDRLLLQRLDLQRLELLVEHLILYTVISVSLSKDSEVKLTKSMTTDSWIFCHKWARKIWMSETLSVGILPCL